MKIAIIGAGHVGQALGKAWEKRGHTAIYGVRRPSDAKYAGLNAAGIAEATVASEVILLSTLDRDRGGDFAFGLMRST